MESFAAPNEHGPSLGAHVQPVEHSLGGDFRSAPGREKLVTEVVEHAPHPGQTVRDMGRRTQRLLTSSSVTVDEFVSGGEEFVDDGEEFVDDADEFVADA